VFNTNINNSFHKNNKLEFDQSIKLKNPTNRNLAAGKILVQDKEDHIFLANLDMEYTKSDGDILLNLNKSYELEGDFNLALLKQEAFQDYDNVSE